MQLIPNSGNLVTDEKLNSSILYLTFYPIIRVQLLRKEKEWVQNISQLNLRKDNWMNCSIHLIIVFSEGDMPLRTSSFAFSFPFHN